MSAALYQDMGPPYVVRARIEAVPSQFDPTLVTAATLVVWKPSGATVEWPTSILTQDANALLVQYAFAGGELDETGFWTLYARCDVPGGSLRTKVGGFLVDPPNKRRG